MRGKIVLCDTVSEGGALLLAGAAGAVMQTKSYTDSAISFPLPATLLGSLDGESVSQYINTTR